MISPMCNKNVWWDFIKDFTYFSYNAQPETGELPVHSAMRAAYIRQCHCIMLKIVQNVKNINESETVLLLLIIFLTHSRSKFFLKI